MSRSGGTTGLSSSGPSRAAAPAGLLGRYGQVLRLPGALGFFLPGAVARLGVAMTGLAVLWTVRGLTGAFTSAGAVTASFAVADALVGPQTARLVDRLGQRRVLPWSTGGFLLGVAGLIAAARIHAPLPVLMLAGVIVGGTVPAVGAFTAARWRRIARRPEQLAAAMSLEAGVNDVCFLCGPMLVTTLGATVDPAIGLVLVAVLIGLGMVGLLRQRRTEPPPDRAPARGLIDRDLCTPALATLFALNLAMGLFFGAVPLVITAFAFAHHVPALAGVITGASSVTSLLAGLLYGAHAGRWRPLTVLAAVATFLTAGTAGLAALPTVPAMAVGYAVVGAAVAPILIPAAVLLRQTTRARVYTQAMTWMNSASAAGIALSAALVGAVVDGAGWRTGALVAAGLVATLPLTAAVVGPRAGLAAPVENSAPS